MQAELLLKTLSSIGDKARQRNIDYDTYESVKQFKTALRWNQQIGEVLGFGVLCGFYIYRDFSGKLRF